MRLGDLLPGHVPPELAALPVSGLTADSRRVGPGFAFFALAGSKADGSAFIPQALAAGAAAIVAEVPPPAGLDPAAAYVRVPDARRALAQAAAAFHPRQPACVLAVTGTSGKSSVVDFTRQILAGLGRQAASLGTVGIVTPGGARYGSLTTPDPVSLHEALDGLAGEGITHLAMEASSHGLDQRRLDGVRLAAAGFTNLGRDHLDYHPTLEDYLKAKLRLFDTLLPKAGVAVVNADGAEADRVIEAARARRQTLITVGAAGETLRLISNERRGFGQLLTIEAAGRRHEVALPLVGGFQASNALVAAGLAIAAGEEAAAVLTQLAHLTGVPGRLERVGEVNGALCVVDYAHKPDALDQVLDALRPFATGRLVCVFGCGGDRDRGKRPVMGDIAARKADIVIVTDDNPRSEDPASIRAQILDAAPLAREICDRAEAIAAAVGLLEPGDVLVVAGKGHETGQIVGDRTLPFSDHDVVRAAIAERGA